MHIESIQIPIQKYAIQADVYHQPEALNADLIIMAHGLGGDKACLLDQWALYYHDMGYQVCVFDHRGYGESTGPVLHLVDKNSQLEDWNTVIQFFSEHRQLRLNQMILWGYSFSGGHVLSLAAEQHFKGIISNFPHVDGLASLTLYPKKYLLPATFRALQDLALAPLGKVKTMPVVAQDRFAILAGADCYDGYQSILPKGQTWHNAVPARIVATIGLYRPTTKAHLIKTPTLVVGASDDSLIPIQSTRKLANKLQNGQYLEVSCGHFDLFHPPFQAQIMSAHQQFLNTL